jgi:aminopeptidase N
MEVVSVVSTLASLIAFGASVVRTAHSYIHPTLEFKKEINQLADEISQLLGVLLVLKSALVNMADRKEGSLPSYKALISEGTSKSSSGTENDSTMEHWKLSKGEFDEIAKILEDVQKILNDNQNRPGQTVRNNIRRLRWAFIKEDVKELLERIERQKSKFILSLVGRGTYGPFDTF